MSFCYYMQICPLKTSNIPNLLYSKTKLLTKYEAGRMKLNSFVGNIFNLPAFNMHVNKYFLELKNDIMKDYIENMQRVGLAHWNYATDTSTQNMEVLKMARMTHIILNDVNIFNHLKMLRQCYSKNLTQENLKLLDLMIANSSCGRKKEKHNVNITTPRDNLLKKDNEFDFYIDGKPISHGEIMNIIGSNTDKEKVEKAQKEMCRKGTLLSADMKDLIITRNRYAQEAGYTNFYDYLLEERHGIKTTTIKNLLNQLYEKIKDIDVPPMESGRLDINLEKLIEITKDTYKNMGFDIDEYVKSGKLTLDLLPRQNKSSLNMCCIINPSEDVRISTNMDNSVHGSNVLFHELGHAMLELNINLENKFFGKNSQALNEALAIMMELLPFKENILNHDTKSIIIPYLLRLLRYTEFELKMYENPEQDLKQLWYELSVKYKQYDKDPEPSDKWAAVTHYITHPVYYQNYVRAFIMQAQLYNYLKSNLGNLSENPQTAEFMKEHIFKLFMSENENDLIKKITGEELSAKYLINF